MYINGSNMQFRNVLLAAVGNGSTGDCCSNPDETGTEYCDSDNMMEGFIKSMFKLSSLIPSVSLYFGGLLLF